MPIVTALALEAAEDICAGFDGNVALCHAFATIIPNEFVATTLATMLPTALRILFILVAAYVLHRIVRRMIRKLVSGMTEKGLERLDAVRNKSPLASTGPVNLTRATMRTETIGGVLRSLASVAIWTVAVLMIVGEFGVSLGPLIAGAGIVGIALGFGSQKLVQDFLAGIFMIVEDQYGVGDIIDVGDAVGTVEAIGLRTTRIRDLHGSVWHVPNGTIQRVANFSQEWSRALLDVGVAYDTDIPHATEVIERTARELSEDEEWAANFVDVPEVWGVQALGESEITIRLVMKVIPAQQWKVEREMRARLKAAFDKEGIEIPFPQRTVWHRYENGQPDAPAAGDGASGREPAGEGAWGPPQRPEPGGS